MSNERHNKITADRLSDIFCIGLERAKQTLQVTRQRGTRSAILPIGRRYCADLMYDVKRLNKKLQQTRCGEKLIQSETTRQVRCIPINVALKLCII